jgi:hypothetical protein
VISTITVVSVLLGVTGFGETVQLACAGAPEQVKDMD